MAANFGVTISEMTNAASKISQAASDFLQVAGQVLAAAENLGSSWEGDSQVAFSREQANANAWYKQMVEIVNTYVDALNTAAKKYQEADDQSTAAINAK